MCLLLFLVRPIMLGKGGLLIFTRGAMLQALDPEPQTPLFLHYPSPILPSIPSSHQDHQMWGQEPRGSN